MLIIISICFPLSIGSYLWKATSINNEWLEKLKSTYFVSWDQKLQFPTYNLL